MDAERVSTCHEEVGGAKLRTERSAVMPVLPLRGKLVNGTNEAANASRPVAAAEHVTGRDF
jgi:hypothetical protein